MNSITFDYNNEMYHIQRAGQPVEFARMNPRAAAHVAVILAARGWRIEHAGLLPAPELNHDALAAELHRIEPVQRSAEKMPTATQSKPRQARVLHTAPPQPKQRKGQEEGYVTAYPGTVGVKVAAQRLNLSPNRIYQLVLSGELPSERVTRGRLNTFRIPATAIDAYIANPPARKKTGPKPRQSLVATVVEAAPVKVSLADKTLSIKEAAEMLDIDPSHVSGFVKSGRLQAEKFNPPSGRWQYRIKLSDLLAFADERAAQA